MLKVSWRAVVDDDDDAEEEEEAAGGTVLERTCTGMKLSDRGLTEAAWPGSTRRAPCGRLERTRCSR